MVDQPSKEIRKSIIRRFFSRLMFGTNTALALTLALVLFGMLNYLSNRHFMRFDLSRARFYALSPMTLNLLDKAESDLKAVVFFHADHELLENVMNLLKEYEVACPRFKVEYVDPDLMLSRAELLAREYKLESRNVVVFDYDGRTRLVSEEDLKETEYEGGTPGQGVKRVSFRGEVEFSSAIRGVLQGNEANVYFLQGHGERDPGNFDQFEGYSGIARLIRRDNANVYTIVLGEQAEIPADCHTLVVAGPTKKLAQPELDLLREYLEKDGRLLVLADAMNRVGLDTILEDWGVRLQNDVVVDPDHTFTGREVLVRDYGAHPIVRDLKEVVSVFHLPRSVGVMEGKAHVEGDRPKLSPLAFSSAIGWSESNPSSSPITFDPQSDQPGPISLAMAVEQGTVAGLDVEIRPTRLVVIGDSDFVSNRALTGGNTDLFLNALNWLLEREELLSIDPKAYNEYRLVISDHQLMILLGVVVAGVPGLVGLLGLVVWVRRRS